SGQADQIARFLEDHGHDVLRDVDDISLGEHWKERISELIADAEKMVFLISPSSVSSPVCAWEIENADAQGKQILPLLIRRTNTGKIPTALNVKHFIPFVTPSEREVSKPMLLDALLLDLGWEREKARLTREAMNWTLAGRHARLLLSREDALRDAEAWRDQRTATAHAPSATVLEFIAESRIAKTRWQRWMMTGSVAVASAMLVLTVGLWFQWNASQEMAAVAARERLVALEESERANRQAEIAIEAERKTEAARETAEAERNTAEAQTAIALAERDRAASEADAGRNLVLLGFGSLAQVSSRIHEAWRARHIRREAFGDLLEIQERNFFSMLEFSDTSKLDNAAAVLVAQTLAAGKWQIGDKQGSLEVYARFVADLENRYRADTTNVSNAEFLAASYLRLAGEYTGHQRYQEAEKSLRASIFLFQRLIDTYAGMETKPAFGEDSAPEITPVFEHNARRASNVGRATSMILEVRSKEQLPPPYNDLQNAIERLETALADDRVLTNRADLETIAAELIPAFRRILARRP
ncbi:MAG: toll/interleukin-1 receptor domain-containing protein, partial [Pseudomonadota bacterium]